MIKNNKKLFLSSLVATALFATASNAGALLDFELGAGSWNAMPSGYANFGVNTDLKDDLGLDNSRNGYIYADFSHFIPLVPNVRIEQQSLNMDATSGANSFIWNSNTINTGSKIELDLTQQDIIFYWGVPGLKLLTAGIVKVDFGIDIKKFDGSLTVNNDNSKLDFTLPMGYLGATLDPPFIPAQINTSYKTIQYDGSSINDIMVKVSIELPIPIPLIDIKLDLGYKEQTLEISKSLSDNISADMKFGGMFFGLSAKF